MRVNHFSIHVVFSDKFMEVKMIWIIKFRNRKYFCYPNFCIAVLYCLRQLTCRWQYPIKVLLYNCCLINVLSNLVDIIPSCNDHSFSKVFYHSRHNNNKTTNIKRSISIVSITIYAQHKWWFRAFLTPVTCTRQLIMKNELFGKWIGKCMHNTMKLYLDCSYLLHSCKVEYYSSLNIIRYFE